MFDLLQHGEAIKPVASKIEGKLQEQFQLVDTLVETNQFRVLQSFQQHRVSDAHFIPSTGYGYDDMGRDALEKIYGEVFGGEAGLVRPQIISGTHAISIALFGVLRPGDELIYMTGKPYDTLEEIVGIRGSGVGSLKEYNIGYKTIDLKTIKELIGKL